VRRTPEADSGTKTVMGREVTSSWREEMRAGDVSHICWRRMADAHGSM